MDQSLMRKRCGELLIALAADQVLGELPNVYHPVVWMGRWLALGERLAPGDDLGRLAWGGAWIVAGSGACVTLAAALPRAAFARGLAASTLLAYRALDAAAGEVQSALAGGELDEARRLLGWHLVSRPTAELNADEVAAAAIESLAENLSDSLVAPMLAYLLGDLPGLAAYRFCNTADAMWGYHGDRYEYLGKLAARADDLLNLAPARLTAALVAIAAQLIDGQGRASWRVARSDHARTASPNAGWPMAAIAGALGTTLTKRGHYALGRGTRMPDAAMIGEARAIVRAVVGIAAAALLGGVLRQTASFRGRTQSSPSHQG